jgi:hypothetical protein
MTETEQKVIEILTEYEVTADAFLTPIHAADRAMGWATSDTRDFVRGLMDRKLVEWTPIVRNGPVYDPKAFWKKGSAYPESSDC